MRRGEARRGVVERVDHDHRSPNSAVAWPSCHSSDDPAFVLSQGAPKTFVRRLGSDKSLEKDLAVALGKNNGLMLRNGLPGRFGQRRNAEVAQLVLIELSRHSHQRLGLFICPEPLAGGRMSPCPIATLIAVTLP